MAATTTAEPEPPEINDGSVVRLPDSWRGEWKKETNDSRAAVVETLSACRRYAAIRASKGKGKASRHTFPIEQLKPLPKFFATRNYRAVKDPNARVGANGWMVAEVEKPKKSTT